MTQSQASVGQGQRRRRYQQAGYQLAPEHIERIKAEAHRRMLSESAVVREILNTHFAQQSVSSASEGNEPEDAR